MLPLLFGMSHGPFNARHMPRPSPLATKSGRGDPLANYLKLGTALAGR